MPNGSFLSFFSSSYNYIAESAAAVSTAAVSTVSTATVSVSFVLAGAAVFLSLIHI